MTDRERLEKIKKQVNYKEWFEGYHLDVDDIEWLIRTVERYEKALEDISKVGWSDRFGGGFSYTGENHAECVKIAKQALEG